MKVFAFKGGVHPPDYKQFSKDKPIEVFPLPKKVLVPMAQHLGVPASPIVKKGDVVTVGQLIGELHGFVSANVHAPISGKVTALKDAQLASGLMAPGVEILSDELDTFSPELAPLENINKESIVDAVKNAGIVGMGGATFPAHVKLQPPGDKKIELLILNAAECEPFLTCDYRLMLEDSEKIIRGAELLMIALGINKCIIGIEDNKPDAAKILQKNIDNNENISVQLLKTHYPQGGEKQLIYALTGKEIPTSGLPMDVGCVVHNVGTAAAVADAVEKGIPLIERVLTVSGDAVSNPSNFKVRIGTPVGELLKAAGIDEEKSAKIVLGGPMTGMAQANLETSVTKGTSGVLAFSKKWIDEKQPDPCLRCGRCVDVCPVGLEPTTIETHVEKKDIEGLKKFHALDCIECGGCAYICPSRRSLVHTIRHGKAQLLALRKAK